MRIPMLAVAVLAAACSREKPAVEVPSVSKWAIDPENSSVTFSCKHVFTTVRGLFQQPTGTLIFDATTPSNSQLDAQVGLHGVTTGVPERDAHLKTPDFFDAPKFPVATFVSKRFASDRIDGELTLHGVTKPVTLRFELSPPFLHAGGIRRSASATTAIDRRDFGLVWDFPGEAAGVVGDVVQLTIDAELVLTP